MPFSLSHPYFLILALGLPLLYARIRFAGTARKVLALLAPFALILAAAGPQVPVGEQKVQIVVAADVSDSIYDLETQDRRIKALLGALDPEKTEAAWVVFGANAGVERPMEALPPLHASHAGRAFPNLQHLETSVRRSATDLGGAIDYARGLFSNAANSSARGILLLSDFRDTQGKGESSAAALAGSGIELLPTPAILGECADVQVLSINVPERGQVGRSLPVEIAVSASAPAKVQISLWRQRPGQEPWPVGFETVVLDAASGMRKSVRLIDTPESPGTAVYTARIGGVDGPLVNDISINNELSAAVRIDGAPRWAVLTHPGSAVETLCRQQKLGAETVLFFPGKLPRQAPEYGAFSGILADGLSAAELPEGSVALQALASAVDGGKALVALGGEGAFGAGAHQPGGAWEEMLPVLMQPEDDRARSILFLIDISNSMDELTGGVRKLDYAAERLAQAIQRLRPLDRVGLIGFSGAAKLESPLTAGSHTEFLGAVKRLQIQSNTDMLPALELARETLGRDDAEEQMVVLITDGIQTVARPREEIVAAARMLAPPPDAAHPKRRTFVYTFGIGTGLADSNETGAKLLTDIAAAGGGFFSPDFLKIGERLEKTFESGQKDYYVRREPFAIQAASSHPLLAVLGGPFSVLSFRNRVKAKPGAETLLWSQTAASGTASRKPDPLLVLSGSQWTHAGRRAALALSLDGEAGSALLSSPAGQRLLPSLLSWAEARVASEVPGWNILARGGDGDSLHVIAEAWDPAAHQPINGRHPAILLTPIHVPKPAESAAIREQSLHQSAPGRYELKFAAPAQGVYRLTVREQESVLHERYVSVPYPQEYRAFGTDRAAMQKLATEAGRNSHIIESPQDLRRWADSKAAGGAAYPLRPWLLIAGLFFLLSEYFLRARR